MNNKEILEKSRQSRNINGDEMELSINGKANIAAKGVFTVIFAILILFRWSKNLNTDDLMGIYFAYYAPEFGYKFYALKSKQLLIVCIIFTILAIWGLARYLLGTL